MRLRRPSVELNTRIATDSSAAVNIRRATDADLPHLAKLGALLVQEHHDFDRRQFLAAGNRTPPDYSGSVAHDSDVSPSTRNRYMDTTPKERAEFKENFARRLGVLLENSREFLGQ